MKSKQTFFDFAAEVGLTKHVGGLEATEALVDLCHINENKYVLDVGCGAGVTPCFLARRYKCNVVGVDILDGMVQVSKARARREGLMDKVEFKVADAQNLPFQDNLFDAVITESVLAVTENKKKALDEFVRVVKPGGYIGLNESTWLKFPPSPEMVAWVSQDLGGTVDPLTAIEWEKLLETVGLEVIIAETQNINLRDESRGILRRYGCGGMIGIFWRMLSLYFRNAEYRKFTREINKDGITPKNLDEYFGYGLYVGRKRTLQSGIADN